MIIIIQLHIFYYNNYMGTNLYCNNYVPANT